jgi:hypothetical protein
MTFGAMAAWQAWLLMAAAGAAAVWLFLLKVRPPRVRVASLLLWTRVLGETREATLWERIRRAVSLVLTAALAIALALAVTRPTSVKGGASAGRAGGDRLLIVLDSSWTMMARTRGGETRWDRAVAEARRLAGSAAGRDVAVATTAEGLVAGPSADTALIRRRSIACPRRRRAGAGARARRGSALVTDENRRALDTPCSCTRCSAAVAPASPR